jgi:hypothetical protein
MNTWFVNILGVVGLKRVCIQYCILWFAIFDVKELSPLFECNFNHVKIDH